MNSTTAFVAGVVTTPAAVAAGIVARDTIRALARWKREHRKADLYLRDDLARAMNAAAIMYAPRVAAITLPGGIVLAWRSKVPWGVRVTETAFAIRRAADEVRRIANGEDVR